MSASFAAEVIADSSGRFVGNALRFGTEYEARQYADDLMWRWFAVKEFRVIPSDDEPNYAWREGKLHFLGNG